jgi:hypothetical protein
MGALLGRRDMLFESMQWGSKGSENYVTKFYCNKDPLGACQAH